MKYVLSGGAGHITKPLAEKLLGAGHQVTLIGRNPENLKDLVALGATAAIGSVDDVAFLTKTYSGADAVYTMVPPKLDVTHWKEHIAHIGEVYAKAIQASGVKFVVNLSSIGADKPSGAGPVTGLHRAENILNALTDVNIVHLRAGYFYQNFLANVGLVKQAGIIGGNFSIGEHEFLLVDPRDIAQFAFNELNTLNFTGHVVKYAISDEVSTAGLAAAIGAAVGKNDLPWVAFPDEQALQAMMQAGLSEEIARNYVEMGQALNNGDMSSHYLKHRPDTLGKIKVADFAKEFAMVYAG
jgi:uncharacterized protein YbjT (DUF2867 family)